MLDLNSQKNILQIVFFVQVNYLAYITMRLTSIIDLRKDVIPVVGTQRVQFLGAINVGLHMGFTLKSQPLKTGFSPRLESKKKNEAVVIQDVLMTVIH